jgi:hypothetical protein
VTAKRIWRREAVIQMHKFHVRQLVQFNPNRGERFAAPSGAYEVTKKLPHNGREYEYRIKSAREGHERTARESQLSSGDRPVQSPPNQPRAAKPSRPPAKGKP